jgi:hypothetical protein
MNSWDFFKVHNSCKGWPLWLPHPQAPVILVAYAMASWVDLHSLSLKINYFSYYVYNDSCCYCGYSLITRVNQFSVLTPVLFLPYSFVHPCNCYYWLYKFRNCGSEVACSGISCVPDFFRIHVAVLQLKCGWTDLINALYLFMLRTFCK